MPAPVFLAPGVDTSIPTGPQVSAKYTLIGPDGTRAVFNDSEDRDYIGVVADITGLDSPEVRESADDLVQMDGGIHGDFFYGRRPLTLTGIILNPSSADDRNRRSTKLMRASNAMRADATLSWLLEGGYEQFVRVRRQQPLRITGAWQKEFQLAVVAADPRIYGTLLRDTTITTSTPAIATNSGNTASPVILTVVGPCTNPVLTNYTTNESIVLTYTLAAGEYLVLDTLNRTVMLNGAVSKYGSVDFLNTRWWWAQPGDNELRLSGTGTSGSTLLTAQWRDAWL